MNGSLLFEPVATRGESHYIDFNQLVFEYLDQVFSGKLNENVAPFSFMLC